ncbi:MFS transporter [Methanomassiliicoccales archaeon LGM-DZ1]|nr:MFS transporter [Methanomassiliicoccales archaeon LGM-DZ1]
MSENRGAKEFTPNVWSRYAILTASMLIIMGAAAVAPALNGIEEEFGAGKLLTSFVVTLPALAVACFGFPMGTMADKLGMRFTLILSLIIFTVFGIAGYFATSIGMLLAMRFMVGVGIAGIATADNALIGMYYSGPERAKVITQQAVFMGLGVIVLEMLGGFLADIDWKSPFLVYAIGVPILLFAFLGIYNVSGSGRAGPSDAPERDIPRRKARIALCYISIFSAMFCLYVVTVNMSDYLVDMGESMALCGTILALLGAMNSVVPMALNRAGIRLPLWKAAGAAFILYAAGMFLLIPSELVLAIIAVVLVGIGMGTIVPCLVGSISSLAVRGKEGKVLGAYSVFMNLGQFVSAIVVGTIIDAAGFDDAFLIVGIAMAVLAVVLSAAVRTAFSDRPQRSAE